MSTKNISAGGGIGLGGATFLVFLVLKLTGHIDWSWWWVTAPLWGLFALWLAIMIAAGVLYLLVTALEILLTRKRRR